MGFRVSCFKVQGFGFQVSVIFQLNTRDDHEEQVNVAESYYMRSISRPSTGQVGTLHDLR